MATIADAVREWHDLYALFGSASATLIGLLFVAASVGSGLYDDDKRPGLRVFLSPTVVHFTCVLVASLVALCPMRSGLGFAVLVCADGVFGTAYAAIVFRRMARHSLVSLIGWDDRICYAMLPAVAYAVMIAGGIASLSQPELGLVLLSGAMALLLLVGIRNAWDMTLWTVVRRTVSASQPIAHPSQEPTPAGPRAV